MKSKNELMQIIEGILFVYGEDGISFSDLQTVLENEKPSQIKVALEDLNQKYEKDLTSAFSIQKFSSNKYRLQTKPNLYEYLVKLENVKTQSKLSISAIEVLSIIAYKGPITKSEVDEIRGVDSTYQIYKLKERVLIRTVGKNQESRANLYGITDNFYKFFNLTNGLESLPKIDEEEIENIVKTQNETKKGRDIFGKIEEDDLFEGN